MSGNPQNDFESLARRYWAAWGDALRAAVPDKAAGTGTGGMPGMGGIPGFGGMPGVGGLQAPPAGAEAWQQAMDWWSQLAHGGRSEANDALSHFNSQARRWYGRMQEVAARFAGHEAGAVDVARAWKEALGASGENPFPEMLRSMRGHGLQGLEQWVEDASPWLDAVRGEGMALLRMPAFGADREKQERMQALAAHMAEYQQASNAYAALMLKAQQEAFVIFEDKLVDHEEPGRQIRSARALFDLWIDAAEEAYAGIALSPEFREVYGNLVNAQMRVRAGVQRMVEDACTQLGMPTRTELDGAHRKLAQLEREVRRLRDALAGGPAGAARRAPAAPQRRQAHASAPAAAPVSSAEALVPPGRARRVVTKKAARSSAKVVTKPAARRAPARAAKTAAKRVTKRAAKKAPRQIAKPAKTTTTAKTSKTAAKRVAKRPARTAAGRLAKTTGARSSRGRSFGGAIAGAMPQAPEPMMSTSKSTKKSVKKGKR